MLIQFYYFSLHKIADSSTIHVSIVLFVLVYLILNHFCQASNTIDIQIIIQNFHLILTKQSTTTFESK